MTAEYLTEEEALQEQALREEFIGTALNSINNDYFKMFDRKGNRIDYARYMVLHQRGDDYIHVAQEIICDVWVSTVWLGISTAIWGCVPNYYETMTFSTREGWDLTSYRSGSEAEAVANHIMTCVLVRCSIPQLAAGAV